MTDLCLDFEQIEGCSEDYFRKLIMKKIRNKAFIELQQIQKGHDKVRYICFSDLSGPQNYLSDMTFTNILRSLLFNLRCRSVKNIKDNFHQYYKGNLSCQLFCENSIDSQEHILICPGIKKHLSIKQLEVLNEVRYEHIFGDPLEQLGAAKAFQLILKIQSRLLDEIRRPAHHGSNSGPTG